MDHETANPEGAPCHGAAAERRRLPEGMRSSIMLIPPLLARFGEARIEGEIKGCTLGVREIDPHIEVFQTFGASVSTASEGALVDARCAAPFRQRTTGWTTPR